MAESCKEMTFMYKAVVLDLDDTLYEYEQINKEAIEVLGAYTCHQFGITKSKFHEAFHWARKETHEILGNVGASHNRILYCQKILEYIRVNPIEKALDMYDTYWGYMLDHMVLRNGAMEFLEHCKNKEIKIGICTDLTAHIQHRKIRKLGIAPWITSLVTSEEAGVEKPSEFIYQLILKKLQVEPEEALFIGDNLEKDVKGPEKAGMGALWFHEEAEGKEPSAVLFGKAMKLINGNK